MPKISRPTELKDAEVFLAAYTCADQLTVLWMSEHLFELLRSMFSHSTPKKKTLKVERSGKQRWESTDALFQGMGPLATASALIKVAYVTGTISDSVYSSFEYVRAIRNQCAHSREEISLSDPDVLTLVRLLANASGVVIKETDRPISFDHKDHNGTQVSLCDVSWGKAAFIEACIRTIGALRSQHFDRIGLPSKAESGPRE